MKRLKLVIELEDLKNMLLEGCGDSSCRIDPGRSGQLTNAGCRCSPRLVSMRLRYLHSLVENLGYDWWPGEEGDA